MTEFGCASAASTSGLRRGKKLATPPRSPRNLHARRGGHALNTENRGCVGQRDNLNGREREADRQVRMRIDIKSSCEPSVGSAQAILWDIRALAPRQGQRHQRRGRGLRSGSPAADALRQGRRFNGTRVDSSRSPDPASRRQRHALVLRGPLHLTGAFGIWPSRRSFRGGRGGFGGGGGVGFLSPDMA